MAKVIASATWTDESGVTRKYEYSGKGTPTHAVIDTSNDGQFIGWTKDPAGYIRKREADHGVLEALPLSRVDDESAAAASDEAEITAAMGGYSDNEGAAAAPGTVDKSIRDPHSPILNPESSGWSLFLARLSTDQILDKMTEISREIVENPEQVDRLRSDLTRYQAEWDRRKNTGVSDVVYSAAVPDARPWNEAHHADETTAYDTAPETPEARPVDTPAARPVDTPVVTEDYVTSTVAEARTAVSTASGALSRMVSMSPDRASVVRAATIRAEVHRALYLIGQVALFTDVNDRAAVAELANIAAQDAVTAASV